MQKIESEFNLLDEPWIMVMQKDHTVTEVSLRDALLQAHCYRGLSGELPTQDIAVLRLLLAVMHSVFYRVDENGETAPITKSSQAYDRWRTLWMGGRLPQKPIESYLEKYRDRFWLIDPERPFGQVPSADSGTPYKSSKLNGELSESSNKLRLFPLTAGKAKEGLTYAQAARWVLYLNGFDDTSSKPKGKNLPSPGAGWLGKCGLITAKGDSLFETLMLNFVLLRDVDEGVWQSVTPIWELDNVRGSERTQIPQPDDQAALLTLQSRRILLQHENGIVYGYSLLGGDFFEPTNAFSEQMTLWRPMFKDSKKTNLIGYKPKRHNASRQFWRDFSAIAAQDENNHPPGIVTWHMRLYRHGCLDKGRLIAYSIASVQYGDKDFFVTDLFSDSLSFHLSMLSELNRVWRQMVINQISWSDNIAYAVGTLAADLDKAQGGDGKHPMEKEKAEYYYCIDMPFRKWLHELSPEDGELDEAIASWRTQAMGIARGLAKELIAGAGQSAFVGRTVTEKKNNEEIKLNYSAPKAYNRFLAQLNKLGR